MKLLSLNLWGGRQGKILFDYLAEQGKTVDIFCFQEVFGSRSDVLGYDGAHSHLFGELQALLPEFEGYFAKAYDGWIDMKRVDFSVDEGQAIFIRKGLKVSVHGQLYIYGDEHTVLKEDFTNESKILQYCRITTEGKELLVANAHGKWHPGDKSDTKERLEQSAKIKEFLEKYQIPKVLCGDMNLDINTRSVAMLEEGMENLIKTHAITNTRNEISWNKYNNKQYFADFAFVSPQVKVKNFVVPYNLVSDHLPLILDFNI